MNETSNLSFKIRDINFDLMLLLFFLLSFFGVFYLAGIEHKGGLLYFFLIVGGFICFFVSSFFIKEYDKKNMLLLPFQPDEVRFSVMLFLGIITVLLISGFLAIFAKQTYSIFLSAFSPFVFAPLTVAGNTFAALTATASPGWTNFLIIFTAGVQEEIICGFIMVDLGIIISIILLKKVLKIDNKFLIYLFGIFVFPIIGFILIHLFNGTYLAFPINFLFAGIFRLLMNFCIYVLKLGLAFSIGFHGTVNALSLAAAFIAGLISLQSLVIFILLIICVLVIINNLKKTKYYLTHIFYFGGW